MVQSSPSLIFKVHRREPELITPSKPTPYEFKPLSDLDDQQGLRYQQTGLMFHPYNPSMQGKDPAKVIREALAKTLVFYYPMAGRLTEGPNRKLIVECTGEGALFIEADADVTLQQFGDPLIPPFPCSDELLFDVPGSSGMINCPLVLIQVTHLKCGSFICGMRVNHTICDAFGVAQFTSAMEEMAKGADAPSVLPVWERHVFGARNPPQVTYPHPEYNGKHETKIMSTSIEDLSLKSFFFGPNEISTLRKYIPSQLGHCSTFEILTACIWKCRTIALQLDPIEEVQLTSVINQRGGKLQHLVPKGYYGNAIIFAGVVTTARELSENPLSFALELVRKIKDNVTQDYVQSTIDLMKIKDKPQFTRCCIMSDIKHSGLRQIDFGLSKPVFSGIFKVQATGCHSTSVKTKNGEDGIVTLLALPTQVMERFEKELNSMLHDRAIGGVGTVIKPKLVSAL